MNKVEKQQSLAVTLAEIQQRERLHKHLLFKCVHRRFKDEPCYLELTNAVCFVMNHPPGSVEAGLKVAAAGFSGVMEGKEGLAEEGRRGTVGRPE